MNKDPSWTDAAIQVLQTSRQPWLTVPEMIKEIRSSGIKQLTNCSYSQACRSLRSAVRHHARKENGLFARSEDTNIAYALRKRLQSPEDVVKVLSDKHPPPITNGLPESEPLALSPSPPPSASPCLSTLTVEIDPALRPPRPQRRSEPIGAFCLPSPHQSILGPRRTLTILSDSALTSSQRPIRKVRHKSKCEEEEGTVNATLPPPTPFTPSLPEILQVEETLPVCAHLSDVVFVKWKGMEGDSRLVQGSRTSMAELEITPGICTKGSVEDESENNDVEAVCLQPTPTTQLLVRRTVHTKKIEHHHSDAPRSEVTEEVRPPVHGPDTARRRDASRHSSASWRTEIIRQVTNLFLPGSLLVGENLKTLLSPAAYNGLLEQQKRKLVSLLPSVDRQDGIRVADGSWTNELFSSALREWHERLAVGTFTAEHRARVRAEEKRQGALRTDDHWKQKYYEEYWGERCRDAVAPTPPPYYPSPSIPPHLLASLKAIQANYGVSSHQDRFPPPSPPAAQSSTANHVEAKPAPKPTPQNNCIRNRRTHQLSCKLRKTMKASKQKPVVKRLGSIHTRKAYQLTPLPPKTPFQTLLLALAQSSQPNPPPTPNKYVAPPAHPHPVFHDHFALLSAEHVPDEFSAPITNLLVRLPRTLYATCMQGRVVTRDHCYTGLPDTSSLKLSVPRSLLRTTCVCSGAPLVFCSMCHALYHISCTHRSLCPSCCKCKA